jgi:hypothetical protein
MWSDLETEMDSGFLQQPSRISWVERSSEKAGRRGFNSLPGHHILIIYRLLQFKSKRLRSLFFCLC